MRSTRLLSSLLTIALAGSSVAFLAPAAEAQATTKSRVVFTISKHKAHLGDKISVSGQVQGQNADGSWGYIPSDAGGVTLQRRGKGQSSWKSLDTDSSGSSFYFYPIKVSRTAEYRVTYSGGTSSGYTFPAASKTAKSKAYRDLNDKLKRPGNKIILAGNVSGSYSKKKVVVQQRTSKHGKWKKWRTVKTSKKGAFSTRLAVPRRGTLYYRAYTPGGKGIEKSLSNYSYRTYRF